MTLTTTLKMLEDAKNNGYAVAAFNCENMEMIQGVVDAGKELDSPVIIQTTPTTVRYGSIDLYPANVSAAAKDAPIPVALMLDHGNSHEVVSEAIKAGYSSIMIDGSTLPLEENIAFTKYAVSLCRKNRLPVEGELGRVGGKEDDTESEECGYTNPNEAVRFVEETGVSSLAIGVGTAHGVYTVQPVLKPELISEIRDRVMVPLVLHGASGLNHDVIRDCIKRGINKVNFATELRITYTQAIRKCLNSDKDIFDPKKYGMAGREAVKKLAMELITLCGCKGRAIDR